MPKRTKPPAKMEVPSQIMFSRHGINGRMLADANDVVNYLISMGCPNTSIDFNKRMSSAEADMNKDMEKIEAAQKEHTEKRLLPVPPTPVVEPLPWYKRYFWL